MPAHLHTPDADAPTQRGDWTFTTPLVWYLGAVTVVMPWFAAGWLSWAWIAGHGAALVAVIAARAYVSPAWVAGIVQAVWALLYLGFNTLQPLPHGYWLADTLHAWDLRLFGVDPTRLASIHYGSWIDEVAAAFYSSYYVLPFFCFFALRRIAPKAVGRALLLISSIYALNYALFFLLPSLGPRTFNAVTAHIEGPLFARFIFGTQGDTGAVLGAVFPSAHVSVAMGWAIVMSWYAPRAAWVAVASAAGIAFSTVYLGFHYGVDVIAGTALAFGLAWVVLPRAQDAAAKAPDLTPSPT